MILYLFDNQANTPPIALTNALSYCVLHNIVVILRKILNQQQYCIYSEQ